jgi:hypothetical protein
MIVLGVILYGLTLHDEEFPYQGEYPVRSDRKLAYSPQATQARIAPS